MSPRLASHSSLFSSWEAVFTHFTGEDKGGHTYSFIQQAVIKHPIYVLALGGVLRTHG